MEKKTQKERIQELTERLEKGVKEVFESGAYENYLKVMSKFHRYSYRNTVLIWMQNPDATYVAGYDAWKNDFNRFVKKGEKGIKIIAPTEYKVQKEQQKYDQAKAVIKKCLEIDRGNPQAMSYERELAKYKTDKTQENIGGLVGRDLN